MNPPRRQSPSERHSKAFVAAELRLLAHMDAFAKMCAESKLTGRILTFSELIDFKVKYIQLTEEQCEAFMTLHLVGCKMQGDRL